MRRREKGRGEREREKGRGGRERERKGERERERKGEKERKEKERYLVIRNTVVNHVQQKEMNLKEIVVSSH